MQKMSFVENRTRRIYYLDVARSFAIVFVALNHALHRGFAASSGNHYDFASISLWLSIIKSLLTVFSRIGVPFFLMISGVLLLDRDYSDLKTLRRFYRHNWLSLVITAEIWYAIMFVYRQAAEGSILRAQGVMAALVGLLKNALFIDQQTFGSMWYMSMILLVYTMIPILSLAVQNLDRMGVVIPAIFVMVTGMLIPNIQECLHQLRSVQVFQFNLSSTNLFSIYLLYILAGYYLGKGVLSGISDAKLVTFSGIALVLVVGLQLWFFSCGVANEIDYNFLGLLILSVSLFECVRRTCFNRKEKAWVVRLSQISLGIYFLHICIMGGLVIPVRKFIHNPLILTITILVVSVFCSVVVIEVLSKYRWARNYLFLIKEGK